MANIKVFDGTSFVKPKAIYVWDGSSWKKTIGRVWNGTAWEAFIKYGYPLYYYDGLADKVIKLDEEKAQEWQSANTYAYDGWELQLDDAGNIVMYCANGVFKLNQDGTEGWAYNTSGEPKGKPLAIDKMGAVCVNSGLKMTHL